MPDELLNSERDGGRPRDCAAVRMAFRTSSRSGKPVVMSLQSIYSWRDCVTDMARVAAALLAVKLTHGRLPSPFTARDVYRNEWTGLTEPRVVQGALACLEDLGWL